MRSIFEKFGLIGSGVLIGVLISFNLSALAEKVLSPQLPIDDLRVFAEVFGKKNSVLGTILCANLVCNQTISDLDIKKIIGQNLTDYKIPRKIYRVEKIETNSNGKLNRQK